MIPERWITCLTLMVRKRDCISSRQNLLEEGSFDSAVQGCHAVFHTTSPLFNNPNDLQTELLNPAVKGTLNVLRSCVNSPTLKRMVLTSSFAAVGFSDRPKTPDVVVHGTWYSNPEFCKRHGLWYVLSKTLSEDAGWKFVKENNIDMVLMNPTLVIGPLLQPELNTSATMVLNLVNGAETFKNDFFRWVDVRDVAIAHILAYENASTNGRYLLVERVVHYSDVVKILRDLYPTLQLPENYVNW